MSVFRVASVAEAGEVIAAATAGGQSLDIVAGGSKRLLGRPVQTDHVLDVSALAGIIDYEPSELVLTARAATPMAEIETALTSERQMLAFEPPDWRGLLAGGGEATASGAEPTASGGEPTLGGAIACNLAGPRRVRAGAARDHFLGFSAVNGWGDCWKAGSRVVKNVTGYDMCKLQSGAFGTLSVLTEISVKVMPRPETGCSLALAVDDHATAIALLAQALNTPHEVSAAAYLPRPAAARSRLSATRGAIIVRLEGPAPSVAFRAGALERLLGQATRLDEADSRAVWREIATVSPLLPDGGCVWRLCPAPAAAPAVLRALHASFASAHAFCDWGGGLLWLRLDLDEAGDDGGGTLVRAAMTQTDGHATLVRAPAAVRAVADVFEPVQGALAALSQRVKAGFDPRGTLNPGRMQKGL